MGRSSWVVGKPVDPESRSRIGIHAMSRTFTLDEAQDLLPILESLLRASVDGKKLIESVDAELQATAQRVFLIGGMSLNVVHFARR